MDTEYGDTEILLETLTKIENEQLSSKEYIGNTARELEETCQWFHEQIVEIILPQMKQLNTFLAENEQILQNDSQSLKSQQEQFIQLLAHLQSNIHSILS